MKLFRAFTLLKFLLMLSAKDEVAAQTVVIIDTTLFERVENAKLELFNGGVDDHRTNTLVLPLVEGGSCLFAVKQLRDTTYFAIRGIEGAISSSRFLMIPGDTITISAGDPSYLFSGPNRDVYECIYKMAELNDKYLAENRFPQNSLDDTKSALGFLTVSKNLFNDRVKAAMTYRDRIATRVYNQILDDQLLSFLIDIYWRLNMRIFDREAAIAYVKDSVPAGGFHDTGIKSTLYPVYIFAKRSFEITKIEGKPRQSLSENFDFVLRSFEGEKRKQLMAYVLTGTGRSITLDNRQAHFYESNKDSVFKPIYETLIKGRVDGVLAKDFSLTGEDGKKYTLNSFNGKIIVMDFWFTGCGACVHMTPVLADAAEKLKGKDVIFLSICVDEDIVTWRKSLRSHLYSFDGAIKLYTQGKGMAHPIVRDYNVIGYPTLIVLSENGKVLPLKVNPRSDGGKNLVDSINDHLKKAKRG